MSYYILPDKEVIGYIKKNFIESKDIDLKLDLFNEYLEDNGDFLVYKNTIPGLVEGFKNDLEGYLTSTIFNENYSIDEPFVAIMNDDSAVWSFKDINEEIDLDDFAEKIYNNLTDLTGEEAELFRDAIKCYNEKMR